MKHKIHGDGYFAIVILLWPENHNDPCNLLGCQLSKEHLLYQTYDEAIMEKVASLESNPFAQYLIYWGTTILFKI